jgi:catechol 2,3-dioxygenase-like lactoylglutathione lyase family enzyme
MLSRPRYVIAVHDLARSAAYYRDVLGFDVQWQDVIMFGLPIRDRGATAA